MVSDGVVPNFDEAMTILDLGPDAVIPKANDSTAGNK